MTKRSVITVRDVAREAGVSPGTVSKALSGQGQLRPDTRERVKAAAARLGYEPNVFAQSLLSGRSYLIGVLTTDSIGRFTIPILTGAEDVLGAGQLSMVLCESRGDPVREQHYLRTMLARRVDGIIVTGRSSDERRTIGRNLRVPTVYALCRSTDASDVSVTHDDRAGAALAVRHLIETGRRRIAIVCGPPAHVATANRLEGALAELHASGLEPAYVSRTGQWSEEWGRESAAITLREGRGIDGAFCMSDQLARGFTDGLRDRSVRVPDDVGVVGMDNWDVMAAAARPPLTTVDFQLASIGNLAASLLLDMIAGVPIDPGVRLIEGSLIMRRSTSRLDTAG